jgi:hypothetical protein
VLYMVEYCMPRGGWCAEVPSFLGFAISVDLPISVMGLTSEDKCDTV